MTENERRRLSKRMSHALRHAPHQYGITLGEGGWVSLGELALALDVDATMIVEVVNMPTDKVRFTIDGLRIRAAQGHSVPVDLKLEPVEPPNTLYHGTSTNALGNIFEHGLKPMSRNHVHLSADIETARKVGARHGHVVVITVEARCAHSQGVRFYQADNGVWLADAVPLSYLNLYGSHQE